MAGHDIFRAGRMIRFRLMEDFPKQFRGTAQTINAGIERGLHIGAQLYVSLHGKPIADAGIGLARPGVEMTPETIMPWLSAGKPLAAAGIAQLRERGKLDWDDPVSRHIPEFGFQGKESITLRHLLMHTGGFRWADFTATMAWEEIIARICAAPLEPRWIVGETAGYHAFTSWYILGEIIRRLDETHRPFDVFVREEIFLPSGMDDCWFSMTPEKFHEYGSRMGMVRGSGPAHPSPVRFDDAERSTLCAPGASGRGPMRQLGRFYEMMLRGGNTPGGSKIISPQSVTELSARQRIGKFDLTFKHIVDWGLGLIVNSAQYGEETVPYGFGKYASSETFGHGGSQSSTAFADPRYGLVVALVLNGMPGEGAHHRRMRAALAAIYEDLHLAGREDLGIP